MNVKEYKNRVAALGCLICGAHAELHHPRFACGMSQREWDNANRISRQETATRVVTVNKGATPPPGSLNIAHMPAAGPGVVIVR